MEFEYLPGTICSVYAIQIYVSEYGWASEFSISVEFDYGIFTRNYVVFTLYKYMFLSMEEGVRRQSSEFDWNIKFHTVLHSKRANSKLG